MLNSTQLKNLKSKENKEKFVKDLLINKLNVKDVKFIEQNWSRNIIIIEVLDKDDFYQKIEMEEKLFNLF